MSFLSPVEIGPDPEVIASLARSVSAHKRKVTVSTDQLSFDDFLRVIAENPVPVEESVLEALAEVISRGRNYRITDADQLGKGSLKAKYKANVAAIRLLREIEEAGRLAVPAEQAVLIRYTGWGGLPQVFDYRNEEWETEYDELTELLTDEEHEAAQGSTLNAHYTSPEIIRFMYEVMERMGLRGGGRILEPALAVGHFLGLMPDCLFANSRLAATELDSISGRIAKLLYPDADIRVMGFEAARFPKNFFDAAIGNVPFGDYKVHDPAYNKYKFSIHEYFFARSLDLVRPGGLVAFITSRYLMDGKSSSVREYLYERADLIGAVRLPCTAFKEMANTEVTSDILFLQKRQPGAVPGDNGWLQLAEVPVEWDDDVVDAAVNKYFADRPERMLGKLIHKFGMYGRADLCLEPHKGKDLKDLLTEAVSFFPEKVLTAGESSYTVRIAPSTIPSPDTVKDGAYVVHEGMLYRSIGDELVLQELPALSTKRIEKLVGLRDLARKLLHAELESSDDSAPDFMRKQLNVEYDSFVKAYGFLNNRSNRPLFCEDPDYPLILSLEIYDDETKTAEKAEVFSRRVIHPVKRVERVDTVKEAFLVTMNECGSVDFGRMAELTGLSEPEIREQLEGLIYRNPETDGWESADEYLSGNVRTKLGVAATAALTDPEFERNVAALKAVQPKDLDFAEIHPNLGAAWIPPQDIAAFINELIDVRGGCTVAYAPVIGSWSVEADRRWEVAESVNNTTTWGTTRCSAVELIREALNNKIPTLKDTVKVKGEEKQVINVKETEAAREKQILIKGRFKEWLWKDPERRERLTKLYNEIFNSLRARTFDGSHLTLPGMSNHVTLRPHQKDAIWRIVQTGTTLLDHEVGAGKTFVLTAAAMEMRRLGLVSKPMIAVPNHLLEQWAGEFLRLYPLANILVTDHERFTKDKRKEFLGMIANNNWDAIIIGHSSYERIPMSAKAIAAYIKAEITQLEEAILESRSDESGSKIVKQLEKAKKRLEAKLKEKAAEEAKDDGLTFEELGIDCACVDESDFFKNLYFVTKMDRIAGLPNSDSRRAFDMFLKTQWLQRRRRPVVFASGTPISNTIAEMFTVMRYLQWDLLVEYGVSHFDSWASTFGEVVSSLEIAPTGAGYRVRNRFARFINVPELLMMYRQVADIQTDSMLNMDKPKLDGGKPLVVVAPASEAQNAYIASLEKRADLLRGGGIDKAVDNMLCVTTDGRKAALDMRLIAPSAEDFPDSKLNKAVRKIFEVWQDTADFKGTQIVFCDLSTPQNEVFSVYQDVKTKLIAMGVPSQEIAFVHDANTDLKKKTLWRKVNSGRVRVLMGSTGKLGAGTNVQRLLRALHHLDVPWRPRDLTQREGRMLRQGNLNKSCLLYRYVTSGSFDAYMYQSVEVKARFISQIKTNEISSRTAEDVQGVVLSYAEVKALASGSPLVLEKFKVDLEVNRLETLRAQHASEQWRMEFEIADLVSRIEINKKHAADCRADLGIRKMPDPFSMELDGKVYTDRKAAGLEIMGLAKAKADSYVSERIGRYAGFELYLYSNGRAIEPSLIAKGAGEYVGKVSMSDVGTIASLDHALRSMEVRLDGYTSQVASLEKRHAGLTAEFGKPFPNEEKLRELLKEQCEINSQLDLDKRDTAEAPEEAPENLDEAA